MNSNIFSANRLDDNQHLRRKKVQELIGYCRKCSQTGDAVDMGQAVLGLRSIFYPTLFEDSVKEFKDLVWNIMVEAGKPNLVFFLSRA